MSHLPHWLQEPVDAHVLSLEQAYLVLAHLARAGTRNNMSATADEAAAFWRWYCYKQGAQTRH